MYRLKKWLKGYIAVHYTSVIVSAIIAPSKHPKLGNATPLIPKLLAPEPRPDPLPPLLSPDDEGTRLPGVAARVGIMATIVRSIAAVVAEGA